LKRAKKDLQTASKTASTDLDWAFAIAYHAMLRAGRALMLKQGFLPTGQAQHKTLIQFCSLRLGKKYQEITELFDEMRKKRNEFIYETSEMFTEAEIKLAVETAKELIRVIENRK
jgi:uncharacterized protein (UPF0332 family)